MIAFQRGSSSRLEACFIYRTHNSGVGAVEISTKEEETMKSSSSAQSKLSRKELLAQYRQSKESNKENVNQIPKGEMKTDLKSKMKNATRTTIAPAKSVKKTANKEKIELAGREKIAPTTPIGKLKRRLQSTAQQENEQILSAPKRSVEDLHQKLLEAKFLTQSHGTKIARSFLENLKTQEGYEWIVNKAIYWLACIKLEIRDRKWERVEQLFSLADGVLEDASDRSALAAAYDDFKDSAEAALKDKLKVIQSSTAPISAPQSEALSQTREPASPRNPFQNVSVSSIRSIFEKNTEIATTADQKGTNSNVSSRNTKVDLPVGKPLEKKLVGGVALIGLTSTQPSHRISTPQKLDPDRERNLELLLLGLGPSEDSTSQSDTNIIASSPETNKKKKCAVRRPVSVKAEVHSDDDEESSTPNKRCRKSDEASTLENFHEKKCLRFHDSIESHKKADQSFRVNRKGTPYKHSRRAIEIEE